MRLLLTTAAGRPSLGEKPVGVESPALTDSAQNALRLCIPVCTGLKADRALRYIFYDGLLISNLCDAEGFTRQMPPRIEDQ